MNFVKVLEVLTEFRKGENGSNENPLEESLEKALSLLPKDIQVHHKTEIHHRNDSNYISERYLKIISLSLENLIVMDLSTQENMLSVNQYKKIKRAIGIAAKIGITDCLLSGIGVQNYHKDSLCFQLTQESMTVMEKYDRLSATLRLFSDAFYNLCLRPVLLPYLGSLFAGLLQLSFAPLKKPETNSAPNIPSQALDFIMTEELYSKLKSNQREFHLKLNKLIEECPQSIVMKELMILHGVENSPRWLRKNVKELLINGIIKTNGVIALIEAVCEDTSDSVISWEKMDVVAKLIAASHGNNLEQYYNSVCSQLIEMLNTKSLKYGTTIANICFSALHQFNPEICIKKIFRVIADPLLVEPNNSNSILKSEHEVSKCIENLSKCFPLNEAEFKVLPTELLLEISIPLFYLHLKAAKGVFIQKVKIRELLLKILSKEKTRDYTFSAFLEHEISDSETTLFFGRKLTFEFGSNGGFSISGQEMESNHEELADSLFDLVQTDETLASALFNYLLKSFSKLDNNLNLIEGNLLESEIDIIERVGKQLSAVKLLSRLSNTKIVQEAQIKNPQPLLSYIKTLFQEYRLKRKISDEFDILYVSLMLIKIILIERKEPENWEPFENFVLFLKEKKLSGIISRNVTVLVDEIINIIGMHSKTRRFQDISYDLEKEREFDRALKDLADPLLPVRAHGLISLTKMIEKSSPDIFTKQDILIYLFQENLKHDDSFIYLTAINGICALAFHFPDRVLGILIQEFIDMPLRRNSGEVSSETRAKLGEILMKTTRSLGEMAPKYKSSLVNAFLCGIRDPDPLVRSSSLSCLGELCKVLGFRLGNLITEILYCIGCIIKTDKEYQCRRAAVLVATLLLRGLGKDMLTSLGEDLVHLYRALKHLRDNDDDSVLRLHAQLALEEFDDVVRNVLFAKPRLVKSIFMISS